MRGKVWLLALVAVTGIGLAAPSAAQAQFYSPGYGFYPPVIAPGPLVLPYQTYSARFGPGYGYAAYYGPSMFMARPIVETYPYSALGVRYINGVPYAYRTLPWPYGIW